MAAAKSGSPEGGGEAPQPRSRGPEARRNAQTPGPPGPLSHRALKRGEKFPPPSPTFPKAGQRPHCGIPPPPPLLREMAPGG